MKGIFITFEGSEGCGKSTQSRLLYDYLKKNGYRAVYLREPGSSEISEKIRAILLDRRNAALSPECELLLYMAARAQVVKEIIGPALKRGEIIICDRFLDSTLAYQGYGLEIDINLIKTVGEFATRGIKPDLTIFLDLPAASGLKKCGRVKDRIEKRPLAYHLRVRKGYLKLAKQEPGRIKVIKLDDDKSVTQGRIREIVLDLIAISKYSVSV